MTKFILVVIIVTFALLLILIIRKVDRKVKGSAIMALSENKELAHAINLLLKNRKTEIFMYDEATHQSYILKNGAFVNSDTDLPLVESRIHPDDLQMYKQTLLENLTRGEGEFNMIYRSRTSEQAPYEWWEVRGLAEKVEAGSLKHTILYGITINITSQKLNELSLKDSQDKLIEINKQNELILNNASSGIVYINSDYEVLWSNLAHVPNFKFPSGVFEPGQKCYIMLDSCTSCKKCPIAHSEIKFDQKLWTKEIDLGPDGIYHIQATPVVRENGLEGTVLRIDNITERVEMIRELKFEKKRAEQLNMEQASYNQLLSTVIQYFPGSLFIKDVSDQFKFLFVSDRLCKDFGNLNRQEVIGHTDYDIFSNKEYADKIRQDDLRVIASSHGNTIDIGEESFIIDGVKQTFQTSKLFIKLSNNREILIGTSINITNIKNLNENLAIAKEKAEESERLKMAFLANMSHEIRTPLNAIVGFSELLRETIDEDAKTEYINIIHKNNELLLRLIGDILDLSKIESGAIELKVKEFDLAVIMKDLFVVWQQRNKNPDIELVLENPYKHCFVKLDKNRVLQVWGNYLSNAFKYTRSGKITIGYLFENDGIRVYVKDTGIGIPEDKQSQLFGRFAKLDDFAQGTGLGLAICKAIAEACGGGIGFESKEGVGSTFWAWLPCEVEISENEDDMDDAGSM